MSSLCEATVDPFRLESVGSKRLIVHLAMFGA